MVTSETSSSTDIAEQANTGTVKRAAVIKALDTITEETIAKCVNILEKLSLPRNESQVSE